ncbi:hypothetical protein [Microbacterium testaceum]|nr:hypothetical protein [Microbacterium testaceum]
MTENTPRGEPGYHPPSFPLFEPTFPGTAGEPQRWLVGWNGLIDRPATDVTLASRLDGATALVTSARWSSEEDARHAAVRALAALARTPRFVEAAALAAYALDDALWSPASIDVDGSSHTATATTSGGVTALYCTDDDAQLAVACLIPVAVRRVRAGDSSYAADPLTPHPYTSLPPVPPVS